MKQYLTTLLEVKFKILSRFTLSCKAYARIIHSYYYSSQYKHCSLGQSYLVTRHTFNRRNLKSCIACVLQINHAIRPPFF